MSLINEALKKTQGPRSTGPDHEEPHAAAAGKAQAPPPRGRLRYLWGFLLSVLVVGILSTIFTSFFIWKLLEEEEQGEPPPPPPESAAIPATAEPMPETGLSEEPTDDLADEAFPPVSETASHEETPPESSSSGSTTEQIPTGEASSPPPPEPDPVSVSRLLELEIRGVMSGGTRVLLHDQATDRTKVYLQGETLEGPLGLKIETISGNTIEFKDHAGQIHTKSF